MTSAIQLEYMEDVEEAISVLIDGYHWSEVAHFERNS